jgi:hypothetical protein
VRQVTERLIGAQPLLGTLAADPSLSGVARAVQLIAEGVERGEGDPATLLPPLRALAGAATAAATGPAPPLDWTALLTGRAPDPLELRRFLLLRPVPDFSALAPTAAATAAVREAAASLGLTPENGVRVRLTGELVMGDEEFATGVRRRHRRERLVALVRGLAPVARAALGAVDPAQSRRVAARASDDRGLSACSR